MDGYSKDRVTYDIRFNHHSAKLARIARMFSQSELAKRIGVSQSFVSLWEEGERIPSSEQIRSLSDALEFPEEFFRISVPFYGPGIGEVFHRRRQISAKMKDSYYAWASIKSYVFVRLMNAVDWTEVRVPTYEVTSKSTPSNIAKALRAQWGIPSGPIDSVSDILASAGVLVIPEWHGLDALDGMSVWRNGELPTIFINADMPEDRIRFTLAHELGHLVMHHQSELFNLSESIEKEAHEFASEFLMPSEEIRDHLRRVSHQTMIPLKRKWKVSRAALLVRAQSLGTISPQEAQALWRDMSMKGWRKVEPDPLPRGIEDIGRSVQEIIGLNQGVLGLNKVSIPQMLGISESDFLTKVAPRSVTTNHLTVIK